MSISDTLAHESGIVRDNDGSAPCIPPHVLAEVLRRLAEKGARP
jgi:hypothetical protein